MAEICRKNIRQKRCHFNRQYVAVNLCGSTNKFEVNNHLIVHYLGINCDITKHVILKTLMDQYIITKKTP